MPPSPPKCRFSHDLASLKQWYQKKIERKKQIIRLRRSLAVKSHQSDLRAGEKKQNPKKPTKKLSPSCEQNDVCIHSLESFSGENSDSQEQLKDDVSLVDIRQSKKRKQISKNSSQHQFLHFNREQDMLALIHSTRREF